jgi:hypothetical protein
MKRKLIITFIAACAITILNAQSDKLPPQPHQITLGATFKHNCIRLSWSQLLNSETTVIERSDNGIDFYYVAAFSNPQQQNFLHNDLHFYNGHNFYRIKSYLSNKAIEYSNIAFINTSLAKPEITMLPAQLGQKVFLWIPDGASIAHSVIADALGRTIKKCDRLVAENNIASIETMGLPAGIYHLVIATANGQTVKLKFTKTS